MACAADRRSGIELRPVVSFVSISRCGPLRRRDRNRLDRWNGAYLRALDVGTRAITVEVEQCGNTDTPVLVVSNLTVGGATVTERSSIERQLTRLLGIDVDLKQF